MVVVDTRNRYIHTLDCSMVKYGGDKMDMDIYIYGYIYIWISLTYVCSRERVYDVCGGDVRMDVILTVGPLSSK